MDDFYFSICGRPHEIQKVYNRLRSFFSELDYASDSYFKTLLLPRGTSEIEVLSKKGYIVSFFGKDFSVYSNFTTNFLRNSGSTRGYNSKLVLKVSSDNPLKLMELVSSIESVDPLFENKENYSFAEGGNSDFLDLL
ncbi:MAG: hypothetical protein KKB62_02015 [Nanoarchaeota archaeon]|nr:hypothetical protein [Nanoarchaeota archaeon]